MAYFTKRYHPPGTAPGTLTADEALATRPLKLRLVEYDATLLNEREEISPLECRAYLERNTITWIHAYGYASPGLLKELGEIFGLHPLALEDVLNTGQRPKLEQYDHQLFAVMNLPAWNNEELSTNQVSLFFGKNYLISFYNGGDDPFEPVRKRLRGNGGRLRLRGADFLFYTLLDVIIDQGFPVLENLGEWIEDLEDELLEAPSRAVLSQIHELKRDLLLLRRMLWPQRELINQLLREDHSLINESTRPYLRDCYDHTVQIMDLFETYRDMAAGMLDVYLSSTSNRLNEVMRVLTVIATIFIPPTFLVGVYGMNFTHMPELHWRYGYLGAWLIIMAMIGGMLLYFRSKKWF
ncbi:MAG: magnesium/cobalt transporter CorA [Gammaproteobacteria bacterium]|jgi:magnesium transporter